MRTSAELATFLLEAKLLVFDFDGTLVDSNEIKWRGFEAIFSQFPEKLDEIMEYCRGSNHTIRGDKFQHVYESILHLPYDSQIAARLHEEYSRATTQGVIEAPETPSSGQFLKKVSSRYSLAVVSNTPHEILLTILAARKWSQFFDVVRGAPVNKSDWLCRTRLEGGLSETDIAFFGDTLEDIVAGRTAGCTLVAVANAGVRDRADYFIPDFAELAES